MRFGNSAVKKYSKNSKGKRRKNKVIII